jgi:TPR repeat protein
VHEIRVDLDKANTFYQKQLKLDEPACKHGMAASCESVGYAYLRGRGVPENRAEALKFFDNACKLSDDPSRCIVPAQMYEAGDHVKKDCAKAVDYYLRACRGGYIGACAAAQHCAPPDMHILAADDVGWIRGARNAGKFCILTRDDQFLQCAPTREQCEMYVNDAPVVCNPNTDAASCFASYDGDHKEAACYAGVPACEKARTQPGLKGGEKRSQNCLIVTF